MSAYTWTHKDLLGIGQLSDADILHVLDTARGFDEINTRPVKKVPTLKGKTVGFNFGEEEYTGSDGKTRIAVKAAYAVSVKTVKEGIEPPPRKTLSGSALTSQGFTEVPAEQVDLPF